MLFPVRWTVRTWWIAAHLIFLSWQDIRGGTLSFAVLLEFLGTGLMESLLSGTGICPWPGILLLLTGVASGEKIGYGDGWLLLGLGMWCPAEDVLTALLAGSILCAAAGILSHREELPFVPFLTMGYFAGRYWL